MPQWVKKQMPERKRPLPRKRTSSRRCLKVQHDVLDPIELQHNGIYLTKFSGGTYNADVGEYQQRAKDVVEAIEAGVFELGHHRVYEMKDAVAAHIDLEGRRTTGSLVMVP